MTAALGTDDGGVATDPTKTRRRKKLPSPRWPYTFGFSVFLVVQVGLGFADLTLGFALELFRLALQLLARIAGQTAN